MHIPYVTMFSECVLICSETDFVGFEVGLLHMYLNGHTPTLIKLKRVLASVCCTDSHFNILACVLPLFWIAAKNDFI